MSRRERESKMAEYGDGWMYKTVLLNITQYLDTVVDKT